jgi:hypothetical protein
MSKTLNERVRPAAPTQVDTRPTLLFFFSRSSGPRAESTAFSPRFCRGRIDRPSGCSEISKLLSPWLR